MCVCHSAWMESREELWESVFSFHHEMIEPRDWIQVVRLGKQRPYQRSQPRSQDFTFFPF